MINQHVKVSNLGCKLRSLAFAVTGSAFTVGAADAATLAIDFTGTEIQGFTTGNFATQVVPLGQVIGSVFIDDNLFQAPVETISISGPVTVLSTQQVDPLSNGSLTYTVNFGSISETRSTSVSQTAGSVEFQEGATQVSESLFVDVTNAFNGSMAFQILGSSSSDLITGDASLGFSRALLESIDLANARTPQSQGTVFGSANGNLVFTIDSFSVRAIDPAPVSPVPLPAGLPLLIAGLGGVFLLRRRKA